MATSNNTQKKIPVSSGKKLAVDTSAKILGNILNVAPDLLETYFEKSGDSKKAAAIRGYKDLLDDGIISQEAFTQRVNKILGVKVEKDIENPLLKPKQQEKLTSVLKIETFREYKNLLDDGTLNSEEFEYKKNQLLAIKIPKKLDEHEKIEAINLYNSLVSDSIITDEDFEKIKERILGMKHQEKFSQTDILNKVNGLFKRK